MNRFENKIMLLKAVSIFALVLLCSTYFRAGGNALYFLGENTLFYVRVISAVVAVGAMIFFLSLKNKQKSSLVSVGGKQFSQKAYSVIKENAVAFKELDATILYGDKKTINSILRYKWLNDSGIAIVVYVDEDGIITDVVI